jgi:hypothetical protein
MIGSTAGVRVWAVIIFGLMTALLRELHGLIGLEFEYQGAYCEVIEILSDGPALVLACRTGGERIQADQFGEPRRRAPTTYTIPLLSEVEDDLHPVVRALVDAERETRLRALIAED